MCARMSAPARNIIQCDKLEKLVRDDRNIKLSFFIINVGLRAQDCDFNTFDKKQFVTVRWLSTFNQLSFRTYLLLKYSN